MLLHLSFSSLFNGTQGTMALRTFYYNRVRNTPFFHLSGRHFRWLCFRVLSMRRSQRALRKCSVFARFRLE